MHMSLCLSLCVQLSPTFNAEVHLKTTNQSPVLMIIGVSFISAEITHSKYHLSSNGCKFLHGQVCFKTDTSSSDFIPPFLPPTPPHPIWAAGGGNMVWRFIGEKEEGQRSLLSGQASWERALEADVEAGKLTTEGGMCCGAVKGTGIGESVCAC